MSQFKFFNKIKYLYIFDGFSRCAQMIFAVAMH